MTVHAVPVEIGRVILDFLICDPIMLYYGEGGWETWGSGVRVEDDRVNWQLALGYGSKMAWVQPSLQEVAGSCGRVYWAFDVDGISPGGQEAVGAISSLDGTDFDAIGRGACFPFTYTTLNIVKQVISFGVSLCDATPRVNGAICSKRPDCQWEKFHGSNHISFLLTLQPDHKFGKVEVFKNLRSFATFRHVNTSKPLFPAINTTSPSVHYHFIRHPPTPPFFPHCKKT
ncbi:hypothetical protein Pelo_6672 [Pelomyxa schiedti]|nr:hypothetical protein Pelo_6672 [Pelomyxa schiedti]